MTLIRAPWQPTTEALESGLFCPLYCVTQRPAEFWDFEDITPTFSGPLGTTVYRLGSTITGSQGTVLTVTSDDPGVTSTTNLGVLNSSFLCSGRAGIEGFSTNHLIQSSIPILSTSLPYTIEVFGYHPLATINVTAGSMVHGTVGGNRVGFGFSIEPNSTQSHIQCAPILEGICNQSGQGLPVPWVGSGTCFSVRLSVDPCNHKVSIKATAGSPKVAWATNAGIGNYSTTSCIEVLRTTGATILDPNGSGETVLESRRLWPRYYVCELANLRALIQPLAATIWNRLEIRPGYEAC